MDARANQGTRLRDWLNIDSAQFHDPSSKVKKKVGSTSSPSSVSSQNRLGDRNKIPNEELVKYMSKLPSYLEKGDNISEKALSFGVLDWRRLEKWQHNHHKQSCYPSSSTDSSYFTTDISSTRTSLGQSCSPGETAIKEADEVQNLTEKSDKFYKRERYTKYQSFRKLQEVKSKDCEREAIEVQSIRKTKIRDGKSFRKVEELRNLGSEIDRKNREKGKSKVLSDDFESNHRGGMKQPSSNIKLLSESLESPLPSSKFSMSPSRGKDLSAKVVNSVEPKITTSPNRMLNFGQNRISRRSSSLDLSSNLDQLKTKPKKNVDYFGSEIPKVRNPSPTRKFSFGLNRFGRRSSSLDFSNVPNPTLDPYMSDSKKDVGFRSEISRNDKSNIGRKTQRSPLRRLLDPLLKPKAVNSNHPADTTEKLSENLYLQSSKTSIVKNKPSTVQALVQMSIKNGLPLYTFADDKTNGVLAATMKKEIALKNGDSSWIYTFFNVDEVKKKNSWINKARKGETHGYVPSVIAQMRVSDIRHNPGSNFNTMESVSFPVDVSEDDQHTSNLQPKDELAAIIVQFPNETPSYMDKVTRGSQYVTEPPFSLTVILPGGSHGHPSKGNPSPLIERWKCGGLCDCGGWDLGCRLKVLTSQTVFGTKTDLRDTHQAADIVELFPQGEVVDDRPVFVLSPFKDHIFSVEFDSSISFLQAFSICISVFNCRKPYDLSEISKLFEGKTENILMTGHVIKAPNPPLSPVGRV